MPASLFRVNHFQITLSLVSLLLSCGFICQAHAEKASTEEWNISADKIVRFEDPNSIVAQGNVVLIKKTKLPPKRSAADIAFSSWSELLEEDVKTPEVAADDIGQSAPPEYQTTMTIMADWMVYDIDIESIKAKGNVQISNEDAQLYAKEGILNLENETGNFSDATIVHKQNSLHLEGKRIEKTGFDTYRINDGWVITCKLEDGEPPPWSFSSSQTDVRQDGYAFLKHAKFRIKDVPVFYSPYLILPVNNKRQTGFLFPEFSSSENSGFGFNLPFFLNVSDSTDITFYPEYLENRGFMPGAELRYVAGAIDKGALTASYLDDKLSDPSETAYYDTSGITHDNSDRYWVRGKADHTFGDWQTRLDIDIVSDEDYLDEFDTGVTGFNATYDRYLDTFGRAFQNQSETERENTFISLRSWDGMALQINLLAINDADTNASSTDTPLWKLPSIDFSGVVPLGESNFFLDWDTNYVDYWREDGIGSHRFDIHPSISAPIPLGAYLESRAEAGVRDTFYIVQTYGDGDWDHSNTQNRLIPDFEIEVATTLEKDFFSGSSSSRTSAHQLRPYVQYNYIPDVDQDTLPQFDEVDDIDQENLITYGLDNFLYNFTQSEGNRENQILYADLKIEQSYDLNNSVSDQPFSDIFSELKWKVLPRAYIAYKNYYDVYDNKFNRHTFEGDYSNSRGDSISLDYSFNDEEDIDQINATVLAHIINGWSVGGEIERSLSENETNTASGSIMYQARCWSVKFETQYTPTDTTYLLMFSLANIGIPLGVGF
ncbi:MAG: LPS-assembly protein LptD [Desulfobulbaceae bacterium]|nr:LPS-assembly protein LptD [Desulfobulbaceae bacterium]